MADMLITIVLLILNILAITTTALNYNGLAVNIMVTPQSERKFIVESLSRSVDTSTAAPIWKENKPERKMFKTFVLY